MSVNSLLNSTKTNYVDGQSGVTTTWQIVGYGMCVGLGLLSGAIGTALVMMAAIMIQLVMFPTAAFAPGLSFFAGSAIAVGLGAAWLIGKICRHLLPNVFNQAGGYELVIVTVIGTVTCVAQTITFMFIL